MSILLRPLITEKSASLDRFDKPQYGFEVAMSASKDQIREEVARMYEVDVLSVNTMIVRGKSRQRFSKRGVIKGRTPNYKKAIVTLAEGESIDFYKHI